MTLAQTLANALRDIQGVELAVLFGSAARGDMRADSDVDVGVMLSDAAPDPNDLQVELSRAAGRFVDLVVMSDAPPQLAFEIARGGRVLTAAAPDLWPRFKTRAMVAWWDWAPTARRIHARAAQRLREEADRGQQ